MPSSSWACNRLSFVEVLMILSVTIMLWCLLSARLSTRHITFSALFSPMGWWLGKVEEALILESESPHLPIPVLSLPSNVSLEQVISWSLLSFLRQNYLNQSVVIRIPCNIKCGMLARSPFKHPSATVTSVLHTRASCASHFWYLLKNTFGMSLAWSLAGPGCTRLEQEGNKCHWLFCYRSDVLKWWRTNMRNVKALWGPQISPGGQDFWCLHREESELCQGYSAGAAEIWECSAGEAGRYGSHGLWPFPM